MRTVGCVVLVACSHAAPSTTPTAPPTTPTAAPVAGPEWDALRGLLGSWEGVDQAHGASGRFSLVPELGGHVLVRRNSDDTPQGKHEDLMIVFPTPTGLRASYYDNEGHVINYAIATSGPHIELTSDEAPGMPRFKLVYEIKSPDELAIDFSIAMPGTTEWKHFTGGTVHRVPPR